MATSSTVLPDDEKQQVATVLEEDAEFMSNDALAELLVDQPEDIQAEIIRINTEARPIALQIALLIPIVVAHARSDQLRSGCAGCPTRNPPGSGAASLLD